MEATDPPLPFREAPWPSQARGAAIALWDWHRALSRPLVAHSEPDELEAIFADERERVLAAAPLTVVTDEVVEPAYGAVQAHGLPLELLAEQLTAARYFAGPYPFETATELESFVRRWAVSHARLLAILADSGHSWQLRYVDELARAFFYTWHLVTLAHDLAAGRLFIPQSDLEQAGVTEAMLRSGEVDEGVRKLLWKQAVRARDAYAQGRQLVHEVPRRFAHPLKRYWIGGLEYLNEVERRDYDVWSAPIEMSRFQRLTIRTFARLGRLSFKTR